MAEELQALLDRINEQGIEKAEQEYQERLRDARKEADNIVKQAESEAEKLVADAREEAELLQEKGRDALRQAARDTMLSLRERLQERMTALASQAVGEDLDPEALANFISAMIKEQQEEEKDRSIEAQVPKKIADDVRKHLMAKLGKDLQEKAEITPLPELSGGFRMSIEKGEIYYDFSDAALAEVLCTFLNPKLAEIIQPALTKESE